MSRITSDVGRWAAVPEWVLNAVSPTALRVYVTLALHADQDGHGHPSRTSMAERFNCSVDTIDRALRELRELGAIDVIPRFVEASVEGKRRQTSNDYRVHLVPPPGPKNAAPPGRTDAAPGTRTRRNQKATSTTDVVAVAAQAAPATIHVDGRNLPFDALAEVSGIQPGSPRVASIPAALNGSHNKPGIRDLAWDEIVQRGGSLANSEAIEVAIADLIRERAAEWRRVFEDATLTPTALLKWWVDLPHLRPQGRSPDVLDTARAAADELRRMT